MCPPIPLRTGAFTPDQIALLPTHLHFDATFVDAGRSVRFCS
jgi:hypothetical protein